jgi:hypothetical protein
MGTADNLKEAAELLQNAGQIELYKKVSAAEDEVRELTREKRRLEDRVEELQHALRFRDELVFDAPFYFSKNSDKTPYCAHCWEKDRRAVHAILQFREEDLTRWACPACKTTYDIRPEHRRQHQISPSGWQWG